MDLVVFLLLAEDVGIGSAELRFVEAFAELAAAFFNFFVDFLFDLAQIIFDQVVSTVTFLRILVVDQRVVERGDVAGRDPGFRMHENAGIDADDVFVQASHRLPPVPFDIVLEFHAHLAVVIHGGQAIVNLAGREDESVFLAVRNEDFEKFFLCHIASVLSQF